MKNNLNNYINLVTKMIIMKKIALQIQSEND